MCIHNSSVSHFFCYFFFSVVRAPVRVFLLRRIGGVAVVVVTVAVDDEGIAQSVEVAAIFGVVNVVFEKQLNRRGHLMSSQTGALRPLDQYLSHFEKGHSSEQRI